MLSNSQPDRNPGHTSFPGVNRNLKSLAPLRRKRIQDANKKLLEVRQRRAAAGGGAQAADGDGERPANTCVVCLERDCGAVFSSCGHMCACWECGQLLDKCPICRSPSRAVRVFTV